MTDALLCYKHLPVCLWIMDPHSRVPKKNAGHGNEVLLQDTTHLIQRPHVTNKEVHAKIQQAIGPHEDLLTIVKRCKLQWYGQVSCSSGLAKTILQVTVRGGRRQGICGAPMTLAIKGLMMIIIIIINCLLFNYCFFLFILRWSCANWQDVKFQLHKIISFLFFFLSKILFYSTSSVHYNTLGLYQISCSLSYLLFILWHNPFCQAPPHLRSVFMWTGFQICLLVTCTNTNYEITVSVIEF